MRYLSFLAFIAVLVFAQAGASQAQSGSKSIKRDSRPGSSVLPEKTGTLLTEKFTSAILRDNRVGLDPERKVKVYLPAGYATSGKLYPVVYYLHSIFSNPDDLFKDGNVAKLIDRGFAEDVVKDFILVAGDYSASGSGSLYENSPVSGRWLDFIVHELVPFIDGKFRTLRHRDSRAVIGHFMGGRGALKMGMVHAETFGVVYALHPVATGIGMQPWVGLQLDWKKIYAAQSVKDLSGNGFLQLFVSVCQGFTPNLNRPPLYCDFFMEPDAQGNPKIHPEHADKAKRGFMLDDGLFESAANLRSLRGLALDWGRFDNVEAHVFSNRNFSRDLEDLGVAHEAEEYRGDGWNKIWTEDGRFYRRVLPFLEDRLVFEAK